MILMCMSFCLYVPVYHMGAVPTQAKEEVGSTGTGIINGCELPCGYWVWNPNLETRPLIALKLASLDLVTPR